VNASTRHRFARPAALAAALAGALAVGAIAVPAAERADPNVRVLTTGDNSELVKTIPIGHKRDQKQRVVMSLPGSTIGSLTGGMAIEASAELEVTTCLKADPDHPGAEDRCTGKTYGFDPHVNARLILTGSADSTSGVQVGRTDELQCSQHLPARNHHCVLVVPWTRVDVAKANLGCSPTCSLNLVASSWSNDAKNGHVLVIGADSQGPVKGDKGRINAVTFADAGERLPKPTVANKSVDGHVPIVDDGAGDPIFKVVYAARIDNPREGDQFMVDARTITKIGSVKYNVELPTEVIVAKKPTTTRSAGVAVYTHPSSQISELNGVNCTQKASAHQTPCTRDKFGVFEVTKDRSELYVNVVQGAEAKLTTQRHNDRDKAKFIDGGYLKVYRFG
jgi:hypothetical protein